MAEQDPKNPAHVTFDLLVAAQSCEEVQRLFAELCGHLKLRPQQSLKLRPQQPGEFYRRLKEGLNYWRAKALWAKLDKRAAHPEYQQGRACPDTKVLVVGAGPCGLRTAVELSLLGCQVCVLEKRTSFSRNNVLHLWPFTISDLRALGAKKFYGKFCSGSLDHISIRQLQLVLLKVCLLLGVQVHTGVQFQGLKEPSGDTGWTAKLLPPSHPVSSFQFDVFVSAGGGRFVPEGFHHKELRGKLAIGITANFVNSNTGAEKEAAEISGVARIYNQKFFQDLLTETGIDLENIVYYKDDTHYFVMTAKKKSLLQKGVLRKDYSDVGELLSPSNVDFGVLCDFARSAAVFSSGGKLSEVSFAQSGAGQPDVAVFDFTCMQRAENAALVRERRGHRLLQALVGDCLVEPFWPLGTGVARGFLAALDTAWMVRSWGAGAPPLKVLAERESVYQLLSQTSPENTRKSFASYSLDPTTRYQSVNMAAIKSHQVQHLYIVDKPHQTSQKPKDKTSRQASLSGCDDLLLWCQRHSAGDPRVEVKDFSSSWRSGLALCSLIHHFRPQLLDVSSLDEKDAVHNLGLAFSLLEAEFGVPPVLSPSEEPDRLSMVLYLTQVRHALSGPVSPTGDAADFGPSSSKVSLSSTQSAVLFLNKLRHHTLQRGQDKRPSGSERRRETETMEDEDTSVPCPSLSSPSEECYFCGGKVYVLERISAEGKFFHRGCFCCRRCGATLRLGGGYQYSLETGHFYCELHSERPDLLDHPNPPDQNSREQEVVLGGVAPSDDVTPAGEDRGHTLDSGPSIQTPAAPDQDPGLDPCVPLGGPGPQEEVPVPKPRGSRPTTPTQRPPVAKPRSILLVNVSTNEDSPDPDSRPRRPLRALRLSAAEKSQLGNLQSCTADSDPDTPGGSSSSASSSSNPPAPPPAGPGGPEEEEGSWSPAGPRGLRNRLCFKRKEAPSGANRVRSKFSPWNLSSPRISREGRLSLMQGGAYGTSFRNVHSASEGGGDDEDDEDEDEDDITDEDEDEEDSEDEEDEDEDLFEDALDLLEDVPTATGVVPETRALGMARTLEKSQTLDVRKTRRTPELRKTRTLDFRKMKTLERRARISQVQRFHQAQSIQRRLEEIEVTFKELEVKGVALERKLRGEEGCGGSDLIEGWIALVHQKNALLSEEAELMVASRQLELEDQQSVLERRLRTFMELEDKSPSQQSEEEQVLLQMLEVVDLRDSLVSFLEEKRLKELSEEQETAAITEARRHSQSAPSITWS